MQACFYVLQCTFFTVMVMFCMDLDTGKTENLVYEKMKSVRENMRMLCFDHVIKRAMPSSFKVGQSR